MKITRTEVGGWQLLAQDFTTYALTGSTSEAQLASFVAPGGTWRALKITSLWSAGANNANAKTPRIRSTNLSGVSWLNAVALASTLSARIQTSILLLPDGTQLGGIVGGSGGWGTSSSALPTDSLNADLNQTFVFSGQLASGGDTLSLKGYIAEYLPR